ncbi:MAG: DUF5309 family protein, partial [Gammaproteobacteria bacterium]|nr:DUF5309 family protein [Gammaproteobacteria bacterium]
RVSELAIPQDPFFRFVSKVAKKATDDPQFKFSEKRPSYHKRYAYVIGHVANGADSFTNSEMDQSDASAVLSAVGQKMKLYMATDYLSSGNVQNVFNENTNKYDVGASGTRPAFFLPGQLVKIPGKASPTDTGTAGYQILRIETVVDSLDKTSGGGSMECVSIEGTVVKFDSGALEFSSFYNDTPSAGGVGTATDNDEQVSDRSIAGELEANRSYVIGSAFAEGSGFPETWIDQPYQSNHGLTQIWKTSMAMTNTARATVLKFEPNEWARVWKEKLVEHKWDIETSLLFGSQYSDGDSIQYTQGAVDYISNYGNQFSLTVATKTQDDFLDDLSSYVDPRYNDSQATLFFCNTAVYNWLHKLSGYFKNNLEVSSNYSADMSLTAKKKVFGVDISQISTVYGDMNVARNIHLDGSSVKMLGINMKNCAYRPLVGNGVNRDTSVYVGVQTLENSGVDRRVDQILTEAGMEWSMAESHAIWT